MRTTTRVIRLASTVILCVAAFRSFGADQNLPKAETILDKYIEVTGGSARYEKLKTQVSLGNVELSSQGMAGTMAIFRAYPNLVYTVMELPVGTVEEGFDGKTAWSKSPMMRPRIKEGPEKASAQTSAIFNGEFRWRDQFAAVELLGLERVGGQECYKILATVRDAGTQTRYYDKNTYLLVKLSMVVRSPLGDIPTETLFSDYREEDGVVSAHRWVQNVVGQQITTTLKKVEYNTALPPDRFELPAEIKALIGK